MWLKDKKAIVTGTRQREYFWTGNKRQSRGTKQHAIRAWDPEMLKISLNRQRALNPSRKENLKTSQRCVWEAIVCEESWEGRAESVELKHCLNTEVQNRSVKCVHFIMQLWVVEEEKIVEGETYQVIAESELALPDGRGRLDLKVDGWRRNSTTSLYPPSRRTTPGKRQIIFPTLNRHSWPPS
jgi:hypothetical protein